MAMKSRRNILAVSVIAMAVAIAGCSSSNDKNDDKNAVAKPPAKPVVNVAELFATAHKATNNADGASEAAAQAVKDAKKYSTMFSTKAVHGVSATAEANAQKVLSAKAAADNSVTNAEGAKTVAEAAKTKAGDVPVDHPQKAELMTALDAAIKAAEGAVKAAKVSQGHADLKTAVTAVVGTDKTNPETPADRGEMVANAIANALMPNSDGNPTRVTYYSVKNESTVPVGNKSGVENDDHTGMTWTEIVGTDDIREVRLNNLFKKVASITGMKAEDLKAPGASGDLISADVAQKEGAAYPDAAYMGITGTVFCLGKDCKVEEGELAGTWVFAPENSAAYYEKVGDAQTYTEEKNYARFGHWLVVDNDAAATLRTYAWTNGNINEVDLEENKKLEGSATYTGPAAGMSVHKGFDTQGEQMSIASGRFTADVKLNARFDDSPTVDGSVSNFQGDAVDPTWKVGLREMTLGMERQAGAGITETAGTGDDGQWNAQAYGMAGKRPMGIFGDFNAHWKDGHAAGAFATRKE